MTIKVEHRPDQLFQQCAKRDCPPHLENTFIGKVTLPTHRALLGFLNEKVVGREFKDEGELQKVLDTWPEFAKAQGLPYLDKAFATLSVSSRGTVACPDKGPGGPLEVGLVKTGERKRVPYR